MNRQLIIDQLVIGFENSLLTYDPLLVQEYRGELEDKTDDQLHKEFQIELN